MENVHVDPLAGTVERGLEQRVQPTTIGCEDKRGFENVPDHILQMKDENPSQVAIMEWKPQLTFLPMDAKDVAAIYNWIKSEYLLLLQHHNDTDEEYRARMRTDATIDNFADKYPTLFSKITDRNVVLNPRLVAVLNFEIHVLDKLQRGECTDEQAKAFVAEMAMTSMLKEAVSMGRLNPQDIPVPDGK